MNAFDDSILLEMESWFSWVHKSGFCCRHFYKSGILSMVHIPHMCVCLERIFFFFFFHFSSFIFMWMTSRESLAIISSHLNWLSYILIKMLQNPDVKKCILFSINLVNVMYVICFRMFSIWKMFPRGRWMPPETKREKFQN